MGETQTNLQNNFYVRQFIGRVFEEFAANLLNGYLVSRRRGETYQEDDLFPDLELPEWGAWGEVKATQKGRSFKVHQKQLEKYVAAAALEFPYSKFFYIFISYNVREISKTFYCERKLQKEVLDRIVSVSVVEGSFLLGVIRDFPFLVCTKYVDAGFESFYYLPNPLTPVLLRPDLKSGFHFEERTYHKRKIGVSCYHYRNWKGG